MKKIALLPFRSNSSRFPRKNFVKIVGTPLYRIVADKISESNFFDEIYLYTDEADLVKRETQDIDVRVVQRNPINSSAHATSEGVISEFLDASHLNSEDWICIFQVTNPMLRLEYLTELNNKIEANLCSSIFTVVKHNRFTLEQVTTPGFTRPRTQDIKDQYIETGMFWGVNVGAFLKFRKRITDKYEYIEIREIDDIDIDYFEDFMAVKPRLINDKLEKSMLYEKLQINQNDIKKYYDDATDPDGNKRDLVNEVQGRLDFAKDEIIAVRELLDQYPGADVKALDVGCGNGVIAASMFENKAHVIGIEPSPKACAVASKNIQTVLCGFYEDFIDNFDNNSLDFILGFHVIEHLNNPNHFLDFCYQKLVSGGYLILGTPDFEGPMARRFQNNFRMLHDPTHQSLFGKVGLINSCTSRGFTLKKILTPFLDTKFMTKKNVLEAIGGTSKLSPAFVGNVMTIILQK
jgi:CMP-N-acetylneuraminic acid synthetase/2-polyprenyl-3-methyl-5-hydroxy-6-metoxy-1,4-benzoquinol methylase